MEHYFEVPFYKSLTNFKNWNQVDETETQYHIARAIFKMVCCQMPGSSSNGKKLWSSQTPGEQERILVMEEEVEKFNEIQTIEKSLFESTAMNKILSDLSLNFGNGKIFNTGGKISTELSSSIRKSFHSEFQISTARRERKTIRYEFKDKIGKEENERLCGVEQYQKCRADLYLLRIDFLNVEYISNYFGIRKKIKKSPFPERANKIDEHPNIIKIGTPIAELQFWELLPKSSVIIKDSDFKQEVENNAEVIINPPRAELLDRPYWIPNNYPSLYQISRVAFEYKFIDKPHSKYTKEELMEIELGEAEERIKKKKFYLSLNN